MHILSRPAEASTRLDNFINETLTRALIALSAVLALVTLAAVA